MSRPLRIEFPGAFYHVTSRGDRRELIYESDQEFEAFLDILQDVVEGSEWRCHAYCLMENHYHLFIETLQANLSKGMRQLNGVFTQWSNRYHGRSGHLFQGRYKAVMVDSDSYFQELCRYIVLNPVRAGMVDSAGDWPWSSYQATAGLAAPTPWLTTDVILAAFGRRKGRARAAYRKFVDAGIGGESIWRELNKQVFLGDDHFVEHMQARIGSQSDDVQIPIIQKRKPVPTLERLAAQAADRNEAIVTAHATGAYSYTEIGAFFGLHFASVGKIVRRAKREGGGK